MSTTPQLTVTPLTSAIGAEVSGVNLNEPLQEDTLNAIYKTLLLETEVSSTPQKGQNLITSIL